MSVKRIGGWLFVVVACASVRPALAGGTCATANNPCETHTQCDDGRPCNGAEFCDPTTAAGGPGFCECGTPPPCTDASECTDPMVPLFCNGTETCTGGFCDCGTPPTCDDGLSCTFIDFCNGTTDACDHFVDPTVCPSDANPCNGVEFCNVGAVSMTNPSGCEAPLPPCNDGIPCTSDACNQTNAGCSNATPENCCTNTPNHQDCQDTNFCNGLETCSDDPTNPDADPNGCVPAESPACATAEVCNGVACVACTSDAECGDFCSNRVCNTSTGGCEDGPKRCDDGADCTDDFCVNTTDCEHDQNETSCCTHMPVDQVCSVLDGQYCNGEETCKGTEECQCCTLTPVPLCEPPLADGTCEEGSLECTTSYACADGTPRCPDDLDPCNGTESCDDVDDDCVPGIPPCVDNDVCDGEETCTPSCQCCLPDNTDCSATMFPPVCTDPHVPVCTAICSDGTPLPCDNGDFCDGTETCDPVDGCEPGTPPDCMGATPVCDEATESCVECLEDADCQTAAEPFCNTFNNTCVECVDDTPCDDGRTCTDDCCQGGICRYVVGGPGTCQDVIAGSNDPCVIADMTFCDGTDHCNTGPEDLNEDATTGCLPGTPPCDDRSACTVDTCDEASETCSNVPDNASCSDGLVCTGQETCAGSCECCQPLACYLEPDEGCPPDTEQHCTGDVCRCCPLPPCGQPFPAPGPACTGGQAKICEGTTCRCCQSPCGLPFPAGQGVCDDGETQICEGAACRCCQSTCGTPTAAPGPTCTPGQVNVCVGASCRCCSYGTCSTAPSCPADSTLVCTAPGTNCSCCTVAGACTPAPPCPIDPSNPPPVRRCQFNCEPGTPPECDDEMFCNGQESCSEGTCPDIVLCCSTNNSCTEDIPFEECIEGGGTPFCGGCASYLCCTTANGCVPTDSPSDCFDSRGTPICDNCQNVHCCRPETVAGPVPGPFNCSPSSSISACTADGGIPTCSNCGFGRCCVDVRTAGDFLVECTDELPPPFLALCPVILRGGEIDCGDGCQRGEDPCDDEIACTMDDCDETKDACTNVPSNEFCDDGVECTIDRCLVESVTAGNGGFHPGCHHEPDDSVCIDDQFCNGVETCVARDCPDAVLCCGKGCQETPLGDCLDFGGIPLCGGCENYLCCDSLGGGCSDVPVNPNTCGGIPFCAECESLVCCPPPTVAGVGVPFCQPVASLAQCENVRGIPICTDCGNVRCCGLDCTDCPAGGTPENEPDCGLGPDGDDENPFPDDTVNGGCNSTPPVFSPLTCGQEYCGTVGTQSVGGLNYRDTDWYQFTVTATTEISWSVTADFPAFIALLDTTQPPTCAQVLQAVVSKEIAPCMPESITACVAPGTYWLFVAPASFTGVSCGAMYTARLDCNDCVVAAGQSTVAVRPVPEGPTNSDSISIFSNVNPNPSGESGSVAGDFNGDSCVDLPVTLCRLLEGTVDCGGCEPGTEPDCSDDDECTNDFCDEATDECVNTPIVGCIPPEENRVSQDKKGSLLMFSKVEIKWDDKGQLLQDTFIDVTNDYPGSVNIQAYYINGDEPIEELRDPLSPLENIDFEPGWNTADCRFRLTANQPAFWSAALGGTCQAFTELDTEGPGRPDPETDGATRILRGYVVMWAVAFDTGENRWEEIRWNHLKGDAVIVNYENGTAWEYNAWGFQAYNVAHGAFTGTPGELHLNGREYDFAFDDLVLDFYGSGSEVFSQGGISAQVDTDITLHPVSVDLRQDGDGPVITKAEFEVTNEFESKRSGTKRCILCWDQTLASVYAEFPFVTNLLLVRTLGTDKGKARISGKGSTECDFLPPFFKESEDAAMLGLAAKIIDFSGDSNARMMAGMNLVGTGAEEALIRYDLEEGPQALGKGPRDAGNHTGPLDGKSEATDTGKGPGARDMGDLRETLKVVPE